MKNYFFLLLFVLPIWGCTDKEDLIDEQKLDEQQSMKKELSKSIQTPVFDWENADWMPTPPNQSRIPSPWVGAGSIASQYGVDVVNDRKVSDGWTLLYNSFDQNAPGPLVNPYFVLYNKYRGIMRIFLYVTTSFVTTSSYLQDGISVVSAQSSLLNFLGNDIIDATKNINSYNEVQPSSNDGALPLASNRWYMMQYELAYDPNISNLPYNAIQLNCFLNYYSVEKVSLGGDLVGSINGVIGSSQPDMFSSFSDAGKKLGTGVLAVAGSSFLSKNTINKETGANKLGLPNDIFKNLSSSVLKAVSSANWVGGAVSLLNGILGGSSGGGPTPISLKIKAEITLKGTNTSGGSFPSSPISFWMPGTIIPTSAVGYIPHYNKTLGVVNFRGRPVVNTYYTVKQIDGEDPWNGQKYTNDCFTLHFPKHFDFSNYLIFNPEILKIADIQVVGQELITRGLYSGFGSEDIAINPESYSWEEGYQEAGNSSSYIRPEFDIAVRFAILIKPKDGSPSSTIIKTFMLTENRSLKE